MKIISVSAFLLRVKPNRKTTNIDWSSFEASPFFSSCFCKGDCSQIPSIMTVADALELLSFVDCNCDDVLDLIVRDSNLWIGVVILTRRLESLRFILHT